MKRHATFLKGFAIVLGSLVFFHALFRPAPLIREARYAASSEIRLLDEADYPDVIEDKGDGQRIWAMRGKAMESHIPPVIAAAAQFLLDTPENAKKIAPGGNSEKELPVLAPILNQDGFSTPRLFAHMSPGYEDITDARGRPLRWHLPENLIAGYSVYKPPEPKSAEPPIRIPVISGSRNAGHYRPLVENFARRYNLNTDLVMAIIHSESDFSPTLVSNKSAMGLMQLLPSTASDEVHRFLYGRRGQVSFAELSVPETNIRYGTAYLHILLNRYFPNVKNQEVREYCAIAAYNMGPNRFLRLYGPTNDLATAEINDMTPEEFLRDASSRLPSRETRYFLEKVRRMKGHYSSLAGS